MSTLSAEALVKRFRGRTVVAGVSLRVDSGEIVGLLGPNGAGKTTCFYMIVGLIPAEDGRVAIDGHECTDLPMHARARMGLSYLAQEPSVFRKLSVRDNVEAILELRRELGRQQRRELADRLLADLGLSHLKGSLAMSLSGGERRRLEIARALAVEPRFVLLDEPFAGVDPISVLEIQKIVKALAGRGIGVLITDHNVRETLGICNRAYIINEGVVLAEGQPDHILEHPGVRSVYLGEHFTM